MLLSGRGNSTMQRNSTNLRKDIAASKMAEVDDFPYHYNLFGLVVGSAIELPELVPVDPTLPDVTIEFGKLPEKLRPRVGEKGYAITTRNQCAFSIEDIGIYYIEEGFKIVFEKSEELCCTRSAADVRLWLLGSAFAALLHQRGILPLHVSAVKAPTGVWAFTGQSGEGKSTLAAYLHETFGWEFIADDVSVPVLRNNKAYLLPGPRKLKLWDDALRFLHYENLELVRDLSNTEKYQIYMRENRLVSPEKLKALVILESGAPDSQHERSMTPLTGIEGFQACCNAIYRPRMVSLFMRTKNIVTDLAPIYNQIEVYRFRRERSLEKFDKNIQVLVRLMKGEKNSYFASS